MFEAVAMDVASQRCQQARRVESADALPDLVRSEGFFEDLCSEPPPILRLRRGDAAAQPAWGRMLASALGLRRA
jgi:hypothetical protein